jgi:hypothetical protein
VPALVAARVVLAWRAGAGATTFVPAGSLELVREAVVVAVLAGPMGGVVIVMVIVTLAERVMEVRVVVVVASTVSLVAISLISFSAVSSLAVAAVLLSAVVPTFRHPRRGRRLERGECMCRSMLAVWNAREPGKPTLLWLTDGDVRVMWVRGDVAVVVDLPQVHTDAVAIAALPACRGSLGDLPRGGGAIHGASGKGKPHHL